MEKASDVTILQGTVLVDVLIPAYNAESTLIEAVQSAMNQSIPDYLRFPASSFSACGEETNDIHHKAKCPMSLVGLNIDVAVCCYNDGSTDSTQDVLCSLKEQFSCENSVSREAASLDGSISSRLFIGSGCASRGAGYARNRASELRSSSVSKEKDFNSRSTKEVVEYFLCLLDSDDIMHPHRISEQVSAMLSLSKDERHATLMGCTFDRDPPDSTWHYAQWANSLTNERSMLERYREVTVLQPTWMLTQSRFRQLGGYIESPLLSATEPEHSNTKNITENLDAKSDDSAKVLASRINIANMDASESHTYRLVHPLYDTPQTLRLAEDLRFYHAHLQSHGMLHIHRGFANTKHNLTTSITTTTDESKNAGPLLCHIQQPLQPLVTYRHRLGMSQSSSTPRKLLLQLRVKAFEDSILLKEQSNWYKEGFIIWGVGRDGKEFYKTLSPKARCNVRCFVDVDERKIESGYYIFHPPENETGLEKPEHQKSLKQGKKRKKPNNISIRVPIVYFALAAKNVHVRERLIHSWLHHPNAISESNIDENGERITGESTTQKEVKAAFGRIDKKSPSSLPSLSTKIEQQQHQQILSEPMTKSISTIMEENESIKSSCSLNVHDSNIDNQFKHSSKTIDNESHTRHQTEKKPRQQYQQQQQQRKMGRSLFRLKNLKEIQQLRETLPHLPIVVCVAMYRTGGALEENVAQVGRTEGVDLWHFS